METNVKHFSALYFTCGGSKDYSTQSGWLSLCWRLAVDFHDKGLRLHAGADATSAGLAVELTTLSNAANVNVEP